MSEDAGAENVETAGLLGQLTEAIYDNGHGPTRANAEHHARAVLPIVEDHVKARYNAGAVDALREVADDIYDQWATDDDPLAAGLSRAGQVVRDHIATSEARRG